MKLLTIALTALFATSCAVLHHAQVGDIDNRDSFIQVPFDIKVSQTGVMVDGALAITAQTLNNAGGSLPIINMFYMGPRTGQVVFNDTYADKLTISMLEKCPSEKITGITAIREMRNYSLISGEIIKVTGYCLQDRT
jgi:hypothetical protein